MLSKLPEADEIIGVGFDKSDTLKGLIEDGYLVCTMAQNPDQMGKLGVQACIKALNGEDLGGEVTDTGVSVLTKESLAEDGAEETEEAAEQMTQMTLKKKQKKQLNNYQS